MSLEDGSQGGLYTLLDAVVRRLVHRGHTRAIELSGIASNMNLQLDRTHGMTKVVEGALLDAKPTQWILRQ